MSLLFLLCKEGTEEIPIKKCLGGCYPPRHFSLEFFCVLFLQEKNKRPTSGLGGLLLVQAVEEIPDAQHILDTQGTVILAVTGAAVAGTFLPQLTAMVGADDAVEAAVMVGAEDLK